MKPVAVAYGKRSAEVSLPEELSRPGCFVAPRAPPAADPLELYRRAIAEAIDAGSWELEEPVAVVLPDETRPVARRAALEALSPWSFDAVVGAGLHPAAPFEGTDVHDARAPDLVPLGETDGIAVRIHPRVATARTVVAVGGVAPHYLAGFSGGAKALVPGVAAEETIRAVHALADETRTGRVQRNPFADAIRRCVSLFSNRLYSLNLLLGPAGPFDATAGPLERAHREAVERYRGACAQPRPAPADVVIADAGGHPFDATLLQVHKAYEAASRLAREGGTIILVASCERGFGHPEFERRLRDPAGPFHPYARTASEWRRKTRRWRTLMVTEMDTTGLGVERVGVAEAVARIPPGSRVLFARSAQELLFVE